MNKKSIDENSKVEVAEKVISGNALYFFPGFGEIEAKDHEDALSKLKRLKKPEVENGNS